MGKRVKSRFALMVKTPKVAAKNPPVAMYNTADILRKRIENDRKYVLPTRNHGHRCPVCGKPQMHFEKSIYIPGYVLLKCDNCWTVTSPMPTRYECRKAYQTQNWNPVCEKPKTYDEDGVTAHLFAIGKAIVHDYMLWQKKADFWDGELKAVLQELDRWKKAKERTSRASWCSHLAYHKSIEKLDICATSLDEELLGALDQLDKIEDEARRSVFAHGLLDSPETFVDHMRRAARKAV